FKMMRRVVDNFLKVASREPDSLCPEAYATIKERKKLACMCYPTFNGDGQFEVREGLRSWVVDIRALHCACGLWQLSGLPCEHALACIAYNRDPIEPYCNPCYTVENYRLAYGNSINPLNDASQWPHSFGPELRAPTIEKPKSGPRQRKRRLSAGELATKMDKKGKAYKTLRRTGEKQKCSVCKKIGHNKRAHGSAGVVQDSHGASSSNPVANNSVHITPPGGGPVATPSVRVTRSKMRVTRGGHT
ncbi:hypothetical protein LINPERHAP2_LOCUS26324, partial [Linum perenne]